MKASVCVCERDWVYVRACVYVRAPNPSPIRFSKLLLRLFQPGKEVATNARFEFLIICLLLVLGNYSLLG